MVKLLFDPITTNDPQFCVMNFKMQQAARFLIEWRDDLFIRYILPERVSDDAQEWVINNDWLFHHPQIEYIKVPTFKDRMKEYYRYCDKLWWLTRFNGPLWDTDIILTCRVPMVPAYKANMKGIRSPNHRFSRKVVVIDDMPVMSFKENVGQSQPDVQDLQHVAAYLASDLNLFINPWERDQMLQVARKWITPSRVRELSEKSLYSIPVRIDAVNCKPEEIVRKTHNREKDFVLGYTQRFEVTHRRSTDVLKTMEKHWIYRGGRTKVRFVCTSNSKAVKTGGVETEGIEFRRPPREEFWRMMREEVDLILVFTRDDGYTLSLMEPLVQGTPAVVHRAPYAEAMLGKDYPFFVGGDNEAYALVKAFMDDYAGLYERFKEWQQTKLLPLLLERNENWFPLQLKKFIEDYDAEAKEKIKAVTAENEIEHFLMQKDEFVMLDRLIEGREEGVIRSLADETAESKRFKVATTFATDLNTYRTGLIYREGYRDASIKPGHLKRVK